MQNGESNNGIIYCRVSSLEQVDGTSLESQERLCKEYAVREGITVAAVFIERGESAKTADRTEFMKAVTFCSDKKNKIKYFTVYKIDRFSRNQTDYAIIKQKLKRYGTEIRSVSEKIDDTPSGKLMEVMLSGFAEFDNNIRTERSVSGMRERMKQGIWVWQAPLGYYRITPGANLTPDPKFAPYIKLAFKEYATGMYNFETLAKYLNERGFLTRNGYGACRQLMEKIIKNPIYCGLIRVWDFEVKGKFDPIIDEKLFYLCQGSRRKKKNKPHTINNPDFPLRKLAVCAHCQKGFTGSYSTGGRGGKYPYYHHHKQNCDYNKFIPKESFEQLFVEYLQEISPSWEYKEVFKKIVVNIWKRDYEKICVQNEKIRNEIKELEVRKKRIYDLLESGTYSHEEFVAQRDAINRKMAQKDALIIDSRDEEINMEEALEYCFNFIIQTAKTWLSLENKPEKRLQFQNCIFDEGGAPFDGEQFGTAKLTPIYSIYREYLLNPSTLVPLCFQNWNQIFLYIKNFKHVFEKQEDELELVT